MQTELLLLPDGEIVRLPRRPLEYNLASEQTSAGLLDDQLGPFLHMRLKNLWPLVRYHWDHFYSQIALNTLERSGPRAVFAQVIQKVVSYSLYEKG
jgi:hypothetical protein